eukprot:COSAG06_NODE_20763_length_782_cov_1.245974_1_plen_117_part_00
MDYGMMDTTQLAEDGTTVIENDETMGVLQWAVNSAYRVTVEALTDAHASLVSGLSGLTTGYYQPADEVLLCLHDDPQAGKPGKGWSKRGDFRPITLCNDLYKRFCEATMMTCDEAR